MRTWAQHLGHQKSYTKAKRAYMRERKWRDDDWYEAWKTTDLPVIVEIVASERQRT